MSTETTDGHVGNSTPAHKPSRQQDSAATADWAQFFQNNGWIDGDKIHCPDELIFEMRFAYGHSVVVYPASNLGEGHEAAPTILHGVITFKIGTDIFYYPWSMLASLLTKLNPRRARKVQGREYAVDSSAEGERRLRNTADLVIEPPQGEKPKTVFDPNQQHAPLGPDGNPAPTRRSFSGMDPLAPSWSAGSEEDK